MFWCRLSYLLVQVMTDYKRYKVAERTPGAKGSTLLWHTRFKGCGILYKTISRCLHTKSVQIVHTFIYKTCCKWLNVLATTEYLCGAKSKKFLHCRDFSITYCSDGKCASIIHNNFALSNCKITRVGIFARCSSLPFLELQFSL